ncbi:hypothetical protein [Thermoanaerobacterium sp. DL9XJH110]|uniref:hypothetical protein n=1 Tax=Thermoanaerobacterium sp. DL9XJH110 TaxID=3386643 RepID=UPI003BB722AE
MTEQVWYDFCKKWSEKLSCDPDLLSRLALDSGLVGRFIGLKSDEKFIHSISYGPMEPLGTIMREAAFKLAGENRKWLDSIMNAFKDIEVKTPESSGPSVESSPARMAGGGPALTGDAKAEALKTVKRFLQNKLTEIAELHESVGEKENPPIRTSAACGSPSPCPGLLDGTGPTTSFAWRWISCCQCRK